VAPASISVRDESVDCVAAETALLPMVPDESQSPASSELAATGTAESLDRPIDNLHSAATLACQFLTSTTPTLSYVPIMSSEQAQNACYSSETMSNDVDNEDEMASDEQLEEWESDVFDP